MVAEGGVGVPQAVERRQQEVLQQELAHHQAQLAKARAAQVPAQL